MRENKCRGKRLDGKGWVFGDYLLCFPGMAYIRPYESTHVLRWDGMIEIRPYEVDPATVGWFTGLIHEGRTEVYDDDVFKRWIQDKVHPDGGIWAYHIVVWVEDRYLLLEIGFKYKGNYSEEWTLAKELEDGDWKYVGSIHDNPELIKTE